MLKKRERERFKIYFGDRTERLYVRQKEREESKITPGFLFCLLKLFGWRLVVPFIEIENPGGRIVGGERNPDMLHGAIRHTSGNLTWAVSCM